MPKKKTTTRKQVDALVHEEAKRSNIPTAEYESVMEPSEQEPSTLRYARNPDLDLDPQLVWRGKDEQDWSDLVVQAPPLYIQEKVHPKVLIDDLLRRSVDSAEGVDSEQSSVDSAGNSSQSTNHAEQVEFDLFGDFNGYRQEDAKIKKTTMDSYWIPGVNNHGSYGRWAFAEFTDVWEMQDDFADQVAGKFEAMLTANIEQPVH